MSKPAATTPRFSRRPGLWPWLGLLLGLAAWAASPALTAAAALPPPAGAVELSPQGGLAASTWFINQADFQKSAHGFMDCAGCHPKEQKGIQPGARPPHPDSHSPDYLKDPARKKFDYHSCAKCHLLAFQRCQKGKHAEAWNQQAQEPPRPGQWPAPTCAHCHNSHTAVSHQDRLSLGRAQVEVCGSCHPAQKATYLENYHGQAAAHLGNPKAAFCTDCHGAHTTVSLKKPQAALKACRRCHPQAPPSFAQMVIHPSPQAVDPKDKDLAARVAVIQALAMIMAAVALVTVLGFYGHALLWMLRELHEKIRRR